jgi:hypothetical protein
MRSPALARIAAFPAIDAAPVSAELCHDAHQQYLVSASPRCDLAATQLMIAYRPAREWSPTPRPSSGSALEAQREAESENDDGAYAVASIRWTE